jgi:hypothetical protein
MTGQPGQVGWATTQLDRLTGAGGNRPGRELRRGRPRGKGSRGTLGSPGASGKVIGAGGGPVAAQLVAADSGSCRRNNDGGGDSGRLGSIPRTGKARRRWRSFPAHRWRLGRCGTARLSGGHGGSSGASRFHGKRGRAARQKEGGGAWRPGAALGGLLGLRRQAGGGPAGHL